MGRDPLFALGCEVLGHAVAWFGWARRKVTR